MLQRQQAMTTAMLCRLVNHTPVHLSSLETSVKWELFPRCLKNVRWQTARHKPTSCGRIHSISSEASAPNSRSEGNGVSIMGLQPANSGRIHAISSEAVVSNSSSGRNVVQVMSPIKTRVVYSRPPKEGEPFLRVADRKTNMRWCKGTVLVNDARHLAGKTSLDSQGFEIHVHETRFTSWNDESHVRSVLYEEAVELVKEATGAKHAHVFDHTLRRVNSEECIVEERVNAEERIVGEGVNAVECTVKERVKAGELERPPSSEPVTIVHVDYSIASGRTRLVDFFGENVAAHCGRYSIINMWRPLVDTVYDVPLGIMDARTVEPSDLIDFKLIFPDRVGENQTLQPNPSSHRWYYLPRQRWNEVLLFKQFDSDATKTRFTPHCVFKDPTVPEIGTFKPRESVEVRAFVFYDADEELLVRLKG